MISLLVSVVIFYVLAPIPLAIARKCAGDERLSAENRYAGFRKAVERSLGTRLVINFEAPLFFFSQQSSL